MRPKRRTRLQGINRDWTSAGYLTQRAMVRNISELLARHAPPETSAELLRRCLDLGCGHAPYRDLYPLGRWTGINIDRIDASPDIVADGMRLPFAARVFDFILCTQVLEHVKNPFLLAAEAGRCLKPGGLFLLTAPMYWPLHEEPHDYWRFTQHGMKELLEGGGFKVLEIRHDGEALALAATALNHLFRGPFFFPVRLSINLIGFWLERLAPLRHSTCNLSVMAVKKN